MTTKVSKPQKPKPFLLPSYCKGCARCVDACVKGCIQPGTEINPNTGLIPVHIDLEKCTACGLCVSACPEPYGLRLSEVGGPEGVAADYELEDPETLFGPKDPGKVPDSVADQYLDLPETEPLVIKGTYASSIGALLAGCRHVYGYPITPSTEGAELMAKLLPMLDGTFYQAVSEVATVNMMYGTAGAGLPCMTFTSSPGFSLMLEGISYMVGSELPGVFVNVMRGGPGLGNIGPEQADIKLLCRGLGHGNSHAIVFAPSTPQEMLDLTMKAFKLSFKYRNPVILAADGYLGQITGKVKLPKKAVKPGMPSWAVFGDEAHRKNLICSIALAEADLEKHNEHINRKYAKMIAEEQLSDAYMADDAEVLIVACNTPSRMAKGAVSALRDQGIKAGLFRPLTLWPFPIDALKPLLGKVRHLVVVEASPGQLEDELRLALNKAGVNDHPPISHVRRLGGVLPQMQEIMDRIASLEGVRS